MQDDLFPNPPKKGDLSWDLQDDPIDEDTGTDDTGANGNSFGLIAMDVRNEPPSSNCHILTNLQ